jgi:hypothetical protein
MEKMATIGKANATNVLDSGSYNRSAIAMKMAGISVIIAAINATRAKGERFIKQGRKGYKGIYAYLEDV